MKCCYSGVFGRATWLHCLYVQSVQNVSILLKINLKKNPKVEIKDYEIIPTWVYREKQESGLFVHRIIPLDEAISDKEKFNLSDDGFERIQKSIADTERILGEDTKNVINMEW